MNPRLGEARAQDRMFDIVEAHRLAPGEIAPALKELAVARLPHRRDWILLHYRVQRECVVRVEPVRELLLLAGERRGRGLRTDGGEVANYPIENFTAIGQANV